MQAIHYLLNGDYHHAESTLRHALYNVVHHLQREETTTDPPGCHGIKNDTSRVSSGPRIQPVAVDSRQCRHDGSPSKEQAEKDTSAFFLYEKAFAIEQVDDENAGRSLSRATAILLYNLALTCHLRGIPTEQEAKDALKWYTLAARTSFRYCQPSSEPVCCSGEDADRLLRLAIYNNTSSLFAEYSRDEQASQCIDWMECLLAASETTNDGSVLGPEQTVDKTTLFHLNVIIFHRAVLAPAA